MVSAVKNIAKNETIEKNAAVEEKHLCNRYKIVRPLSTGGMSQTYLAEDTQRPNQPICVVKQLKASTNTGEELKNTQRLFEREAESLEKLGTHGQIPRLLAYFEEGGSFYLVQEFIEGHPLTHEMPLGEWWSETQVIQLLKELLEVLSFIHGENVIHLDIKPANIIRREHDNKLVLIDFGAVKRVHLQPATHTALGKTQSTVLTCVGTKGYMSIEQMMGKPNLSSDFHALGMTAIQALTGILPLQLRDDDKGEVAWRDQAEVSDALAEVLTKMVRRYHKQRYQSVAEVVAALDSVEMAAVMESAFPLKIDSTESLNKEFVTHSLSTSQSSSQPSDFSSAFSSNSSISSGPNPFNLGQFSQISHKHNGAGSIPTINSPVGFSGPGSTPSTESAPDSIKDAPVKKKFLNTSFFQQKGWLRKVSIGAATASVVMGTGYFGYQQWQRNNDKTALADLKVLVQQ
ncbi:MAG: serine/threonine-protein kinase, partial [Cyanobacteria bacterium J06576_12]